MYHLETSCRQKMEGVDEEMVICLYWRVSVTCVELRSWLISQSDQTGVEEEHQPFSTDQSTEGRRRKGNKC